MRRGLTLHLPPGTGVSAIHAAVAMIIDNKSVEPANDGLFPGLLARTWRIR
jgi:hypothetical protein